MAKKRYGIVELEEDDFFETILMVMLGLGALVAIVMLAVVGWMIAGALLFGWFLWKKHKYSPATMARREVAELKSLRSSVAYLKDRLTLPDPTEMTNIILNILDEELDDGRQVPAFMIEPIETMVANAITEAGLIPIPSVDEMSLLHSVDARNELRRHLEQLREVHRGGEEGVDELYQQLVNDVGHICERLPAGDGLGAEPNDYDFTVEVIEVIDDLKALVDLILRQPFGTDLMAMRAAQDRSLLRWAQITGKSKQDLLENPQKIPSAARDQRHPARGSLSVPAGLPCPTPPAGPGRLSHPG